MVLQKYKIEVILELVFFIMKITYVDRLILPY